jgi:hypothetical protein
MLRSVAVNKGWFHQCKHYQCDARQGSKPRTAYSHAFQVEQKDGARILAPRLNLGVQTRVLGYVVWYWQ